MVFQVSTWDWLRSEGWSHFQQYMTAARSGRPSLPKRAPGCGLSAGGQDNQKRRSLRRFFTIVSGLLMALAVVHVAVVQLLGGGFPQVDDLHLEVQLLAR